MSFVKIRNLNKSYNDSRILKDLSLDIENGEFITLLGPSGCGKTTLLRSIAGLEFIDSGEIYLNEADISRLSAKDRNFGMVFQSYALFPNMNVEENIAFGLKMKKMNKKIISDKLEKVMELVDLKGKEKSYPNQLSGGQQQRVALARTLIMEPKVLLLDEPFSALDAKIRKKLRLQLRKIQRKLNITTIFVTHDQEEALTLSDRIIVMNEGEFSQVGKPKDIYMNPNNAFIAEFIGKQNIFTQDEIDEFGIKKPEGNIFLVRPETINISKEEVSERDEVLRLNGTIDDSIILGNIIRYFVDVNGKNIFVDVLNRRENTYNNGNKVMLYINLNDCVKLN